MAKYEKPQVKKVVKVDGIIIPTCICAGGIRHQIC